MSLVAAKLQEYRQVCPRVFVFCSASLSLCLLFRQSLWRAWPNISQPRAMLSACHDAISYRYEGAHSRVLLPPRVPGKPRRSVFTARQYSLLCSLSHGPGVRPSVHVDVTRLYCV